MKLADQYRSDGCAISFELFPPKTPEGVDRLCENVERLLQYKPQYFTCTYGAGGSSQGTTLEVLKRVKKLTDLPVASHLTCVGADVQKLREFLQQAADMGIDYIVALRGDPPKGTTEFTVTEGGLRYANELVDLIHEEFPSFGIAVAGYPEIHQEAVDAKSDLDNLKRKVDAGADVIITQLFYENEDFYRFRDDCLRVGIEVPIVPGVLPVTNFKQAQRIAKMCKASIPKRLADAMMIDDSPEHQFRVGVDHARNQTIDLLEHDVPGIHYYVLNKSAAAAEMLDGLEMSAAN